MKKATIATWFDYRVEKKSGYFPLKLRLTFDREYKRYSIGIDVTKDQWEKLQQSRPKGKLSKEYQEIEVTRQKIALFINKAQEIIDQLKTFSFDAFERMVQSVTKARKCVYLI